MYVCVSRRYASSLLVLLFIFGSQWKILNVLWSIKFFVLRRGGERERESVQGIQGRKRLIAEMVVLVVVCQGLYGCLMANNGD